MVRLKAKLTSKGQITLPHLLRTALNLQAGDSVVFVKGADGKFVIETQPHTLADLRGIVVGPHGSPDTPISGAQIEGWIEQARGARHLRSRE